MSESRLIVGLGNPGAQYRLTRHNLGFLVLDRLSKHLKVQFKNSSLTKALETETEIDGTVIRLVLPMTFMNHSGVAVSAIVSSQNINLDNVLVICDDLNLEFGQIRVRSKGSDGGNNGLSSIIERLNSEDFSRLRMGIGQPPEGMDAVDYVLEVFSKQEQSALEDFVDDAVQCALVWVNEGIQKAMERYNQRKTDG